MDIAAFLKILEEHYKGVWMLIFMLLAIIFVINWLARIFNWGRYRNHNNSIARTGRTWFLENFFNRLINDFRHLLALVIVLIFASLIFYAMAMTDKFEEKMDALQLVIASLGGLLGSIIGYYFGESAVRRAQIPVGSATSDDDQPEQPIVEPPAPKIPNADNI